jgi:hypothetical protein
MQVNKIILSYLMIGCVSTVYAKKDNTHLTPTQAVESTEFETVFHDQEITVQPEIRYHAADTRLPLQNIEISTGATNTTYFSNPSAVNNGLRDSHVIDAYDGTVAWAWADNATISNKTNNTLNVMVCIGKISTNGVVSIGMPINITQFTGANLQAWDTAITINRTNTNNIVVSYLLINYNNGTAVPYRAYTTNGGLTWINGPMNVPPTGLYPEVGDNRGVSSDKFGNIWYAATSLYDSAGYVVNQPYYAVSSNGGQSFTLAYTVPLLANFQKGISEYDYPQYCFGGLGDGSNAYGLWFALDYYQNGYDITPVVGFIPINGLNSVGTGTTLELPASFIDTQYIPSIAASADGRVWCEGMNFLYATRRSCPVGMRYKAAGAIGAHYQQPWTIALVGSAFIDGQVHEISQPDDGYFNITVQGNLYDETRQALYALVTDQVAPNSQNMYINLYISRTNGLSWSVPTALSTTTFANRGFASMALDPITGSLVVGWYDGRNDPTYKSVEYFTTIIPSTTISALVNTAPLS